MVRKLNIIYSPIRADYNFIYTIQNETITALIEGEGLTGEGLQDTFDFSAMPDGRIEGITTTLPYNPILSAERIDGVLTVVLFKTHGNDAPFSDRFPEGTEIIV